MFRSRRLEWNHLEQELGHSWSWVGPQASLGDKNRVHSGLFRGDLGPAFLDGLGSRGRLRLWAAGPIQAGFTREWT